jgi:hypothetical protein
MLRSYPLGVHGPTVQSMLPVAAWYLAVIAVTPALTPTRTPAGLTVAVFEFPVVHSTPDLDARLCLVPSGIVATADICNESVRPTAHGAGDTAIAETVDDEVDDPLVPHPKATHDAASATRTNDLFMWARIASCEPRV